MSDQAPRHGPARSASPGPGPEPRAQPPVPEQLDEAGSLQLISPGGIGRLAYASARGPVVIPVNYGLYEGTIVFRTAQDSPTNEDLRTGIAGAEYVVAFEVDRVDSVSRDGWSVFIQGRAHHVDSETERALILESGVEAWPSGPSEQVVRIFPTLISGRRFRRVPEPVPR
jgi:nitroimidazol reductase NimA-like FMN-containing flavoprotein (pyridoxamine 5'-phosphate oxidase superfamily)